VGIHEIDSLMHELAGSPDIPFSGGDVLGDDFCGMGFAHTTKIITS
jgi:hypothetical protein